MILGSFWDDAGVTLGSFWAHLGIILGFVLESFWGHPESTLRTFLRFNQILIQTHKFNDWCKPNTAWISTINAEIDEIYMRWKSNTVANYKFGVRVRFLLEYESQKHEIYFGRRFWANVWKFWGWQKFLPSARLWDVHFFLFF